MLDTRYHIVSLVAVFLALGLGILIGTIVAQDPDLLKVQNSLIDQLSHDLKALDEQNSQSRARLMELESTQRKLEAFAAEVFPRLVANRLFGRSVAVILMRSPSMHEELAAVTEALSESGAMVRTIVLGQSLSDMQAKLQELNTALGDALGRGADLSATATALVESVVTGYDASLVERLVSSGLLDVEPLAAVGGVDAVVVVAQSGEHAEAMQPLLTALLQMSVPVVGASRGTIPAQRQHTGSGELHVIYELDSVPGQYRLVMELAGEGRGAASRSGALPTAR